jgi:predicted methyltransferase
MKILAQLKKALKPGGVLGLIDMETNAKEHNPKLHRVNEAYVKQELAEAGFELDGEAAFLRNPNDDYSKVVFDPKVRGKTDRFVLRFKKPS